VSPFIARSVVEREVSLLRLEVTLPLDQRTLCSD